VASSEDSGNLRLEPSRLSSVAGLDGGTKGSRLSLMTSTTDVEQQTDECFLATWPFKSPVKFDSHSSNATPSFSSPKRTAGQGNVETPKVEVRFHSSLPKTEKHHLPPRKTLKFQLGGESSKHDQGGRGTTAGSSALTFSEFEIEDDLDGRRKSKRDPAFPNFRQRKSKSPTTKVPIIFRICMVRMRRGIKTQQIVYMDSLWTLEKQARLSCVWTVD
jgi:hypothetical protein